MDVLLAIGSFNAFFFALLIYTKANKTISDKIMGLWIALFGFNLLTGFFAEKEFLGDSFILGIIAAVIFICHFPMLYIYSKSQTDCNFIFGPGLLVHLTPLLLMLLSMLPLLNLEQNRRSQITYDSEGPSLQVLYPMLILIISSAFYLIMTNALIKRHKKQIQHTFSYGEKINLAWIQYIVYGFISLFTLIILTFSLLSLGQINIALTDYIVYIGLILLMFYIAYHGYRQGRIFSYPVTAYDKKIRHNPDVIAKDRVESANVNYPSNEVIQTLITLMENEKPYLDPELTIYTLARQINLPAHQLSRVINSSLNLNFFEFVNQYRVNEFKSLLANPDFRHYSILAVALEAGFNSKASFNRIFKNSTRITPSEYRKTTLQ